MVSERVSLKRKRRRVVVDSHQEDAYGSDGHDGSHYVETEAVHRPGDPTPVILLLQNT